MAEIAIGEALGAGVAFAIVCAPWAAVYRQLETAPSAAD